MSDKLDWLNQHFVLLRHGTVSETIEKEKFVLRPDLACHAEGNPASEAFVARLSAAGESKAACDYLLYAMHRRAAVWWAYQCVVSLLEELEEVPAQERDIADIGKPKPLPVPEWAKKPEPSAEEIADEAKAVRLLEGTAREVTAAHEELLSKVSPEVRKEYDECVALVLGEFKRIHGVDPLDFIKQKIAEYDPAKEGRIDENSPIFAAERELKAKIEAMRQETVELIKSVIPPKVPEHVLKLRNAALDAVWAWIAAPTQENAKRAYDAGNAAPDTPAGLLALAAFWSFGNLDLTGKLVVPTPPGLAPNGLSSVLLQCGLHAGGTRKFKPRMAHYLELGLEVAAGRSTWEKDLGEELPPHRRISAAARASAAQKGRFRAAPAWEKA